MNEITLHLGNGHPIDIHIDGAAPVAINAFVLLTSVPVMDPQTAYTMSVAAKDILDIDKLSRNTNLPSWATDGPESGNLERDKNTPA